MVDRSRLPEWNNENKHTEVRLKVSTLPLGTKPDGQGLSLGLQVT